MRPVEMSPGRPLSVTEDVAYQEGSIVSRILLRRGGGTLTLFAFDEGQSLSPHMTPFDALVVVLEGQAEITVSGNVSRVAAGQMILMPANESHAVAAPTRFKMLLAMIRPD